MQRFENGDINRWFFTCDILGNLFIADVPKIIPKIAWQKLPWYLQFRKGTLLYALLMLYLLTFWIPFQRLDGFLKYI
jgi:hypothetical protein